MGRKKECYDNGNKIKGPENLRPVRKDKKSICLDFFVIYLIVVFTRRLAYPDDWTKKRPDKLTDNGSKFLSKNEESI